METNSAATDEEFDPRDFVYDIDPLGVAPLVAATFLPMPVKFRKWVQENHFTLYQLYRHSSRVLDGCNSPLHVDFSRWCLNVAQMASI